MSSRCKLCFEEGWELKDISTSMGSSVFVIIDKLFSIRIEDKNDGVNVCEECYDLLTKCNKLYEKVLAAQQKLTVGLSQNPFFIKQEVFCDLEYKTEFQDVDNTDYFDDCKLSSPKEDDYVSEDDLPILQSLSKITGTKVKKKKIKSLKTKKGSDKLDLNNLIDKDGLFTVNGKILTELVDKFYKLVCDICSSSDFYTMKELFDHFEEKHSTPGYVVCCDKKFKTKRNINHHMAWHVQPSAFECQTCKKKLARPSEIKYHMQSHLPHKQRPYQCDHCGRGFIFLSKFKKHIRKHEDDIKEEDTMTEVKKEVKEEEGEKSCTDPAAPKTLINKDGVFTIKGAALDKMISQFYNLFCELCTESRTFKSIKGLFEHYDVAHKIRGYVTCCDTQFDRRKYINYHMAKHLQPSAFECHICKKSVSRPGELKFHIQHHLPDAQKPLQCDECGKGFVYLSTFKKHKMTHVPIEKRKIYECKFCSKTFNILTSYSVHVSSKHSGPTRLCSHCGKSIKGKVNYINHLKSHEPSESRESERVKCPQCGISIANMMGLKKHLRRHSVTVKCEQCDYVAHSNTQLKKHVMIRHTDLKPHVCMICNKGFKLKHSMKVHMAQHTGERNYSCPYCPRTFMDPGNCYSHQKKMHPIELKNNPKKRKNFDLPPPQPQEETPSPQVSAMSNV